MSKIFKINRIAIVTTALIVTPVLLAAQSASSEPLLTPLWGGGGPLFQSAVRAAPKGSDTASGVTCLGHGQDGSPCRNTSGPTRFGGVCTHAIRFIGKAEMEGYLTGHYAEKVLAATEKSFWPWLSH